jgi:protein-disulfide isomerase
MTDHGPARGSARGWAAIAIAILLLAALLAACAAQVKPEAVAPEEPASEESASPTATPTEAPAPVATAVEAAAPTAAAASLAGGVALPSDETYKGLPVGFTEEGLPYRGEPDAPIVMVEYSDFQCPFCSRYFVQTEPSVDESFVRNGPVRVVFHDMPGMGRERGSAACLRAHR